VLGLVGLGLGMALLPMLTCIQAMAAKDGAK